MEEALASYGRPEIFNTDQGSQFTSAAFTGLLKENGIRISPAPPAPSTKVCLKACETVSEARRSIGEYLEFYNGRRPHSSLDRMKPDQFYLAR